MPNIDGESSDDEGISRPRVYQREELLRIRKTSSANINLPTWIENVLSNHQDCGHIILPSFTETGPEEVDLSHQSSPED